MKYKSEIKYNEIICFLKPNQAFSFLEIIEEISLKNKVIGKKRIAYLPALSVEKIKEIGDVATDKFHEALFKKYCAENNLKSSVKEFKTKDDVNEYCREKK